MSAVSSEGGDNSQDFDLNIAPIIDCFTVLIAYLMLSVSFISLAAFDVGVAVSGVGATPDEALPKDPPLSLSLQLFADRKLDLKLTGGKDNLNISHSLEPTASSNFDTEKLLGYLTEWKEKYPTLEDINIGARSATRYREVVQLVEFIRPVFPKIFLSGEKVESVGTSSTNKTGELQ